MDQYHRLIKTRSRRMRDSSQKTLDVVRNIAMRKAYVYPEIRKYVKFEKNEVKIKVR